MARSEQRDGPSCEELFAPRIAPPLVDSSDAPRDLPPRLRPYARTLSHIAVLVVIAAALLQIKEAFSEGEDPWLPMGSIYVSAAALGLDAAMRVVRRRRGEGLSIVNLAPGGWAIFGAMFWIVAVPAYFFGARRRAARPIDLARTEWLEGDPREPIDWGSWLSIAAIALLGLGVACFGFVK